VRRSPSRLLIIEQAVPEDDDFSEAAQSARANLNDLYLWVLYGGRVSFQPVMVTFTVIHHFLLSGLCIYTQP
jgi:hypothetical protein